ncbi:MAG TPA: hypothetical protein VF187_00825, partial [Gemmatimonadales bacterium]
MIPRQLRRGLVALAAASGLLVPPLMAQGEVDSARVAREAWRQAVPLMRRGEYAAARELVRRSYRAWPAQPAYLAGFAALSARLLDTSATIEA